MRLVAAACVMALALLGAPAASADDDEKTQVPEKDIESQPVVAHGKRVILHSDEPLKPEDQKWIMEIAEQAYSYDLQRLGWQERDPVFAKPFDVTVISPAALKKNNWSLGGSAYTDHVFGINGSCFKENQHTYYIGILAHELTHMLVMRRMGDVKLKKLEWYPIMGEGIAMEDGNSFGVLKSPADYPDHRHPAKKEQAEITGAQVAENFAKAAKLGGHKDSDMGVVFVEFLKTGGVPNPSKQDVMIRMGRVLNQMHDKGSMFPEAFKAEFGEDLGTAEKAFAAHMKKTEGNPEARFAGMMLSPPKG